MRSSAFVTMAIGSPVQGSLRTLRNIEEAMSTPPVALDRDTSTPTTASHVVSSISVNGKYSVDSIKFF